VLTFRGSVLSFKTFSIIITCVNLFFSITWAVVISSEGGGYFKWYEPKAMPLSKPRVWVIVIAIDIRLGLSLFDGLFLLFIRSRSHRDRVGLWI
jgi:hypothetical protein